ncbi:MAG: phosphoribosyl-ATP diphosphatase [Clostridia bacterium]|nr:phosphoribosyl-ATP diphosphatase [Clostridia bacterium]
MDNIIKELLKVIEDRQKNPLEKSYTCYLLDEGTDKILKKIGEECSETIIAVKNKDKVEIVNEICDLIYHLLVMTVNEEIDIEDIEEELKNRTQKQKNLKNFHQTDKNS